MESNNWRPAQSDTPPNNIDASDWRSLLQPESRHRIVNKIMETLKKLLPCSGQDGILELKKSAVRYEEKIYSAATSQSDYLRKISLKMLTMETKSQNMIAGSLATNPASSSRNPMEAVANIVRVTGDWRSLLQPDSRHRIVNKIMETLKKHLPFSGQDGILELKNIAVRFEEKIYSDATSQSDYLRKISLKMLTMETKSQNTIAGSLATNPASSSRNPMEAGKTGMDCEPWSFDQLRL